MKEASWPCPGVNTPRSSPPALMEEDLTFKCPTPFPCMGVILRSVPWDYSRRIPMGSGHSLAIAVTRLIEHSLLSSFILPRCPRSAVFTEICSQLIKHKPISQ